LNKATSRLILLSRELGLSFEPQDWGIVNADGSRLHEFISFFGRSPGLHPNLRFELAELILASANELLLKDADADLSELAHFLIENFADFSHHIKYWCSLDEPAEYPIGLWIKKLLEEL
jgi:hypothetical protein